MTREANCGDTFVRIHGSGPGYEPFVEIIRSDYEAHHVSVDAAFLPSLIEALTAAQASFVAAVSEQP